MAPACLYFTWESLYKIATIQSCHRVAARKYFFRSDGIQHNNQHLMDIRVN